MKDKERILMLIVTRIIPRLAMAHPLQSEKYIKSHFSGVKSINQGDLVFANTALYPNDFMVGFVEKVDIEKECLVVREIGSERCVNYSNEWFTTINKEIFGYEILEGVQYQTYQKVLKAFSKYVNPTSLFKSISFDGTTCTVEARKPFGKGIAAYEISFEYNNRTSIKSIGLLLEKKDMELLLERKNLHNGQKRVLEENEESTTACN